MRLQLADPTHLFRWEGGGELYRHVKSLPVNQVHGSILDNPRIQFHKTMETNYSAFKIRSELVKFPDKQIFFCFEIS